MTPSYVIRVCSKEKMQKDACKLEMMTSLSKQQKINCLKKMKSTQKTTYKQLIRFYVYQKPIKFRSSQESNTEHLRFLGNQGLLSDKLPSCQAVCIGQ